MPAEYYNPYESQPSLGGQFASVAGEFLNPVGIARANLTWPTAYNPQKGFNMWVGSNIPKMIGDESFRNMTFDKIGRSFKVMARKPFKGTMLAGKNIGSIIGGSGFVGSRTLSGLRAYDEVYSKATKSIGKNIKGALLTRFGKRKAKKASKFFSGQIAEYVSTVDNIDKLDTQGFFKYLDEVAPKKYKGMVSHLGINLPFDKTPYPKMGINKEIRRIGAVSKKLPYGSPNIARGFRGALSAGRVLGTISLATFAWDMINMIGEPVGRGLINKFDEVMDDYNRRFEPEMGGQLALSYLSSGAATERQRAVNALSKSNLNGRSAFGQEAQLNHY